MTRAKNRFPLRDRVASYRRRGPSAFWPLFIPAASLMLSVLIATGCDSSSSPTSPAAPSPFSGTWTGITDQGEPILFSVSDNGIELFLVAVDLTIQLPDAGLAPDIVGACFSNDSRFNLTVDNGLRHPFDGHRFEFEVPRDLRSAGVEPGFLLFDGILDASGRATGRLIAEVPLPFLLFPCLFRGETTWVANRQ